MRFAVHDLRTASAFEDERGRRLEAIVAEGPALLSAGRHALFAFPTGDPSAWPELATDAWAMWPERVYVAERSAEPDRWRRGPLPPFPVLRLRRTALHSDTYPP